MDSLKSSYQDTRDSTGADSVTSKGISKSALTNKLNYLNFSDRTLLVTFRHDKYGTFISVPAQPLPCAGDRLECLWAEPPDIALLRLHTFENILINDGHKCLIVRPDLVIINEQGISTMLPEMCQEIRCRKMVRHPCHGIIVLISQHGALYDGTLIDVSPVSFCAHISTSPRNSFQWLNCDQPVTIQMFSGHNLLYSGECEVIRHESELSDSIFVLRPLKTCFQRFKPKKFRSTRHRLIPSPNVVFQHPLSGTIVNLKVQDISGAGFSVEESETESLLFAGLVIPELELQFSCRFSIKCQAQVVYRTEQTGHQDHSVRCGMTILNMDMNDQITLLSLLQQAENKGTYIDTTVDMDALWNFFFETGFIYPAKYAYFQANKQVIKKTYERLYHQNPSIARHFTYRKNGHMLGHLAMVRFYENAWMIHHHAAVKSESMKAGMVVLKQISNYINELHHLSAAHLKYVYCYFRPENKFPNRIFGGFAQQLNDTKGSSIDTFCYFHYKRADADSAPLPEPWHLSGIRPRDFGELNSFYRFNSGGLMLDAFDLHALQTDHDLLAQEYERLGLKKEKRLYSLLEGDELKAVIIADITDIGFNMANLTSSTTVIVLDETTPRTTLESALALVATGYEQEEMPVLVYPQAYAEANALPVEKHYSLWILNMQYTDSYFMFCDTFFHHDHSYHATDDSHGGNGDHHP